MTRDLSPGRFRYSPKTSGQLGFTSTDRALYVHLGNFRFACDSFAIGNTFLLHPGILGFSLRINRNPKVGIFPQRKELPILSLRTSGVALHGIRTS
jgi:hypothetical protein